LISSHGKSYQDWSNYVKTAVFLHGFAAEIAAKHGEIGIIASDVIEQLPLALGGVETL
jgi:NAD(P)H-hydrate repair Nnr-like enzyme with NAD(P)H-hydrate dehydratase domain